MTNTGPGNFENSLFTNSFSNLKDYRRTNKGNLKFSLQEIIFLTLSAVISGFTTYDLIAQFGIYEIDWLRKFFPYKKGTPSHDTLGEFYSKINPKEFADCLISFTKGLKGFSSDLVALDGKTVRGFLNEEGYPLHILTAFCTQNHMSLGEDAVHGKENEITAIPRLLELLYLKGCVVSIDAMGCQTKIAQQIIGQQADYVLQVKGNQRSLLENLQDSFSLLKLSEEHTEEELGHGRIEKRRCLIISNLDLVDQKDDWLGLKTLIKIESEVCDKKTGLVTESERYYISSLNCGAERLGNYVRKHWSIESMHWSLDVIFSEDFQAKRNQNGIMNFNTLSKCANSLLVDEKTFPKSKPLKRQKSFAQREYREKILKV